MDMEDKSKKILIILGVIISLVIGSGVTVVYYQTKIKQLKNELSQQSVQEAIVAQTCIQMSTPVKVRGINGKVDKIESNVITLTDSISGEKKYSVSIADGTEFLKVESSVSGRATPTKRSDIEFSDIKAGDIITAIASEDFGDKTEFKAKTVALMIPLD
jgi:hypothetical protein